MVKQRESGKKDFCAPEELLPEYTFSPEFEKISNRIDHEVLVIFAIMVCLVFYFSTAAAFFCILAAGIAGIGLLQTRHRCPHCKKRIKHYSKDDKGGTWHALYCPECKIKSRVSYHPDYL